MKRSRAAARATSKARATRKTTRQVKSFLTNLTSARRTHRRRP